MATRAWRPRIDLIAAAALFSTGGAAIKGCSLTNWQVAGLRSAIAAVFLLIAWPRARRGFQWRSLLFGFSYAATLATFVSANKLTTAANTIFLQSTAPLYVLLLAPLFLKEHVRRRDLLYMLALAVGLVLCVGGDAWWGAHAVDGSGAAGAETSRATAPRPLLGNWIAVASGVLWGCTIVGLRWFGQRAGGEKDASGSAVVVGNLLCFVACATISVVVGEPFFAPLAHARAADLGALAFLGVFQVGLAYVLVTRGMRGVPALEASLLLLVEPTLNPLWAFLVHHERPGAFTLLGGAVILGATAVHAASAPRVALS